jgi:hypothetical protein
MYPVGGNLGSGADPGGYTYAAVLANAPRDDVLSTLREVRFSGWIAPPDGRWTIAIPAAGDGTVAAGRRGVVGVGDWLADRVPGTVLAIRVIADRQLLLVAWTDGIEIGRYLSDPSYGLNDDTLPEPLGTEHAAAFAVACDHAEAADDLEELLGEELDPDSVIESERLDVVLRLLGLPSWLVAVSSLPKDVPTGPRAADLTRLGAGAPGILGRIRGRAADVIRRRRPPPPPVTDAPRGGVDPWLL